MFWALDDWKMGGAGRSRERRKKGDRVIVTSDWGDGRKVDDESIIHEVTGQCHAVDAAVCARVPQLTSLGVELGVPLLVLLSPFLSPITIELVLALLIVLLLQSRAHHHWLALDADLPLQTGRDDAGPLATVAVEVHV